MHSCNYFNKNLNLFFYFNQSKLLVKDQILRPSIKDLFNEPLIKRTMEEFVESKGNNVEPIEYPLKLKFSTTQMDEICNHESKKFKNSKSLNSFTSFKRFQASNSFQVNDQKDISNFSIGNTIYSVDFNENDNNESKALNFADKTIENKNQTIFSKNSILKKNSLGDTAYENIPIQKRNVRFLFYST